MDDLIKDCTEISAYIRLARSHKITRWDKSELKRVLVTLSTLHDGLTYLTSPAAVSASSLTKPKSKVKSKEKDKERKRGDDRHDEIQLQSMAEQVEHAKKQIDTALRKSKCGWSGYNQVIKAHDMLFKVMLRNLSLRIHHVHDLLIEGYELGGVGTRAVEIDGGVDKKQKKNKDNDNGKQFEKQEEPSSSWLDIQSLVVSNLAQRAQASAERKLLTSILVDLAPSAPAGYSYSLLSTNIDEKSHMQLSNMLHSWALKSAYARILNDQTWNLVEITKNKEGDWRAMALDLCSSPSMSLIPKAITAQELETDKVFTYWKDVLFGKPEDAMQMVEASDERLAIRAVSRDLNLLDAYTSTLLLCILSCVSTTQVQYGRLGRLLIKLYNVGVFCKQASVSCLVQDAVNHMIEQVCDTLAPNRNAELEYAMSLLYSLKK